MPGHCDHSLSVPSFYPKSHVKRDNVSACPVLMKKDYGIRGLDISPLKIAIDVRMDPTHEYPAATCFNPGNCTGIAG